MSNSTSLPSPTLEPIQGISIFWPLFTLALASALHPLGSTCGEKPTHYRYYLRALPLSALLDSLSFFNRCGNDGHTACILARLDENNPKLMQQYLWNEEADCEQLNLFLDFVVDFKARVLPDVLVVLAYVKLCIFSVVPSAITLGSFYFLSWFFLEGLLMAQQFRRREMKMEKLRRTVTEPRQHENRLLSFERVRAWNRLLLIFQVFAFLCISTIVLVRHTWQKGHRSCTRPPPHFTTALMWFFTPAILLWNWVMYLIALAGSKFVEMNFFLAVLHLFFFYTPIGVILCFSLLFGFCLNLYAFIAVLACPLWAPYLVYHNLGSLQRALKGVLRSATILSYVKIFSFVVFASSIVYYAALYDSKGVSKRAWSDVLG